MASTETLSGAVISDNATGRGSHRAASPKKSPFRRNRPATPGRRVARDEEREGLTPELLEQLRAPEVEPPPVPRRSALEDRGPGIREVLAGIDADLRADPTFQRAVSSLSDTPQLPRG